MVAAVVGSVANGGLLILFVSLARTLRSKNKTQAARTCRERADGRPSDPDRGSATVGGPSSCRRDGTVSERRPSSSRRAMISCDLNVFGLTECTMDAKDAPQKNAN